MATFFAYVAAFAAVLLVICTGLWLRSRAELNRIKQTAYYDPLTGGLTEAGFQTRCRTVFSTRSTEFALVSMQVVNFPQICEILGTPEDSQVYQYLYNVLKRQLGGDELIARTGESTFCFMLKNRNPDEIFAKLNGICDAAERFQHGMSDTCSLQLAFGVYLPEKNSEDTGVMLRKAVLARQDVSADVRCRIFDHEEWEKTNREREIAAAIPKALKLGEFQVYLQPKVRISDQRVVGAEALIRWRHPQRGLLSPDMFLPLAERHQKSDLLNRFVLEEVCRAIKRWEQKDKEPCPVSVNLSSLDIRNPRLPEEYYEICQKYGVPAGQIEFEMKESLAAENLEQTRTLIERFHALGFRCALDNFGADTCSLQLLGELNIDTVKLDQSFFNGENNSRRGRYIAETLLKLAAQLHIHTVAEGISYQAQAQYLQQAACDIIQGFYYFKPMQMETFEQEVYEKNMLRYVEADQSSTAADQAPKHSAPPGQGQDPAQNIILFTYWPQEDAMEFSDVFSPILENQTYFENATALFRTTNLIHENDREDFFRLLERCQRENGWVENTLRLYTTGGRYEWLEVRMHQDNRSPGGVVSGMLANMSGWKSEVNRWKEKASRDALTGLYNREHFEPSVTALLNKGVHTTAALLFIDVDDFKKVNDTYGHMFGDDVLCYMAKQILGVFRHTDIVARYGGDEFVVFAPSIEQTILEDRLKQLCATFQYPFRNDTAEYKLSGSIGAAMFPQDGLDYDTLLDHADCALYEAKHRGKNQYAIYEPHMKGDPGKQDKAVENSQRGDV